MNFALLTGDCPGVLDTDESPLLLSHKSKANRCAIPAVLILVQCER